ncbi:unnamed protein product [Paramecium pentaurelia]|uniref:Uncharacterized protein n=1 Tax=Paramecium pentaurelia TaxID=43138 RepID=A0A8S1UGA6_9CILI|nr:unnamed protein product [Paramecium pentaurelia]
MLLLLILIHTFNCLTLKCVSNDVNETYTRGDHMTICIHFINKPEQTGQRLAFDVKVDRYTALYAKNSYTTLKTKGLTNHTIAIQANKHALVSPILDYVINSTNVYPIYSLVVNMEDGNVTDLIWDNGCWDSSMECSDYVITNSNGESFSDSNNYYTECTKDMDCDAKIYISFIGTDASGNYMESAGKRISRFRQYAVSDMFSSAKNVFSGYVDDIRT